MLHKYTVTLANAEGEVLDQWVLERPQENAEESWLNTDGKLNAGSAIELVRQIGVEVNKHAASL